ncbi:MAG: SIMPL domain-containing protein [Planctomycetes bacterium]|nr:SIMPL domain-containing protein [Planctomycetota bacterium]
MRRFIAITALLAVAAVSAGAEDRNTITVRGKGTVRVRPDRLVLVLGASGKAEKATDAVEKLNKKKDEIRDAVDKVLQGKQGLNVTVKDSGLTFGAPADEMMQIRMMGGQQPEGAGEMAVTTEVQVTVGGIDKMQDADLASLISSLVDKANEAGAEMKPVANRYNPYLPSAGGSNGVFFGFSDYDKQAERAWDEAAKKARERAESIANRLGLIVGDAVRVKDTSNEGSAVAKASNPYAAMLGMASDDDGPKIKSSGEMELSVEMEVEFELKKK